MPADPHRSLLRHTGTNHVRHGGSPEIVEQKARLSNGLDSLPPSAAEVSRLRLAVPEPLGLVGFDSARRDSDRAEVAQLGLQGSHSEFERATGAVPGGRIVLRDERQQILNRHPFSARTDVAILRQLVYPLAEMGNGFRLARRAGALAVLSAVLPKLDSPPPAPAVDAAKPGEERAPPLRCELVLGGL